VKRRLLKYNPTFRSIINKIQALIWKASLKMKKNFLNQLVINLQSLWSILLISWACLPLEQIFQKKLNLRIKSSKKRKMKRKIHQKKWLLSKWKVIAMRKWSYLIYKLIVKNNCKKMIILTEKIRKAQKKKVQKKKSLKKINKISMKNLSLKWNSK
jgi:hypothetical protein